jgi:hypothetical protein
LAGTTGLEPAISALTVPRGLQLLHAPVPSAEVESEEGYKIVAGAGIEPACVAYETTEEPLLNPASMWSGRRDFNPRSPVPETGALNTRPLPVNLVGMGGFEPPPPCPQDRWAAVTLPPEILERLAGIEPVVESLEDSHSATELQPRNLERSAGIEPAPRHWQCRILPLNHDRPIWWRRRGMIPRFQFAGLESSQLDDAPKSGAP